MERSDNISQLDGLPRHWPQQGINSDQGRAATTQAAPGENAQIDPNSLPSDHSHPPPPIPVVTGKGPPDSPPENGASHGGELVASPEILSKHLPEELKALEHTDNPDDLKEHLATVTPISSKRTTSAVLEDPGIKDLGWREDVQRPVQLIRGVPNESLFMLVRRFNKKVQHVRAIPPPPLGLLDLDIATDEEFSPDKLRANLERLYMTVIVSGAAFGKHIARLRSWNEPRRTTAFVLVYFFSWYLNLLSAVLFSTLLILMFCPPSRRTLFPPAPLAAVSATTGNLQVPRAGGLGSDDSLTGAPEAHRGEAVEQEASHFVASIAAIGTGTVLGQGGAPKRKKGEARGDVVSDNAGEMGTEVDQGSHTSDDSFAGALPDPSDLALKAKNVKDTANVPGGEEDPAAQVAKKSVEGAMWEKMRPVMRTLADVADGWERFANALEPAPPFPKYEARFRLAAVVVPLLVTSFTIPAEVALRGTSFLIGLLLFSQPVLSRAFDELNHRVPHWRKHVELRRTILRGVPTNAQLTLTLLRIAEQAKAPLPPPPIPRPYQTVNAARAASPGVSHPPEAAEQLKERDFAFDAENYEVEGVKGEHEGSVAQSEGESLTDDDGADRESVEGGSDKGTNGKKTRRSKLVGFLKKTTRAGVGGVLGVDHLKAKVGDEHAKRRLGAAVPRKGVEDAVDVRTDQPQRPVDEREVEKEMGEGAMEREGPTSFSARVHGRKGRMLVVSSAASPCVSFVAEKLLRGAEGIEGEFSVGVADIVALRKMGGFGWKGKLVVGWATGRDVLDGLEIVDRWGGRRVITAVKGRDELFNRLIAMGAQKWECL